MRNCADKKEPGVLLSAAVLIVMVGILMVGVLKGAPTITLLVINIIVVLVISMAAGYSFGFLEEGLYEGIKSATSAVTILILVGALIASWMMCGTVPMLIYYGIKVIKPGMVLLVTFLLCSVVSAFIGSSWGTAGTIGIACVAMATSMGIPVAMSAGAAISGAILGDKISPLSDSTILISSANEIDIFDHIHSMLYTSLPAILLAAVGFYVLGLKYTGQSYDMELVRSVDSALAANFKFTIWLLLPFIGIIVMSVLKVPSLLTIMISIVLGVILTVTVQGQPLNTVMIALNRGMSISTGVDIVDTMLNKGGINSMLSTVGICILALGLGGILHKVGYLKVLVCRLTDKIHSPRALVLTTFFVGVLTLCVVVNFHVAVVLVSSMFAEVYDKMNIHRSVLTRTIEEANTLTLPVIPWNASCIYYMGVFELSGLTFAPYVFFLWANVALTLLFAVFNLFIFKRDGNGNAIWKAR